MKRTKFFLARLANQNRHVADVAYALAYPAWWVRTRIRGALITAFRVPPATLHRHRGLSPASTTILAAVTSRCNARCVFCGYRNAVEGGVFELGVMPFGIFKKVVDEWAALRGELLDLTPTAGDPLLDPGLLQKIEYAVHQAKIKRVVFNTNGIRLCQDGLHGKLVESGLSRMDISIAGTDREVYRQVYGVDRYDDVLRGVRSLLEYNRDKGNPVHICIRFRNARKPGAILESADFRQYIKPYLGRRVECHFTVEFDNWGGTVQAADMVGVMRLRKVPRPVNVPCRRLFSLLVRHDGRVRLCGCRFVGTDVDELIVGDMTKATLEEISLGDQAWRVVEGFYSGKRPEVCRQCTLYRPIDWKWLRHHRSH